jgi:hypothetical protein
VDFVILWKGTILVLEVKGGQIGRTKKGLWYSMDRDGSQHPLRRSPWAQAKDAAFTLLHVLSRLSDDAVWPFAYAVVTPDQTLAADPESVWQQHIGLEQMTPAGLERGLDALARLARPLANSTDHPRQMDLRPMGTLSAVFTDLRREVDAMRTAPDTEMLIEGKP